MSIFDLTGQARPKKKAAKKVKKKAKKKGKRRWGTSEEKYRRLCLHAQFCRYAYYVKHVSIIPDELYDKLEHTILAIEDVNRTIIDQRYSPTCRPGSDNEKDYPHSAVSMWSMSGVDRDEPDFFANFGEIVEGAMDVALKAFGVKEI